jgi:hypothetical protein
MCENSCMKCCIKVLPISLRWGLFTSSHETFSELTGMLEASLCAPLSLQLKFSWCWPITLCVLFKSNAGCPDPFSANFLKYWSMS